MFETMMIAFREGMEAFLIVAITLAYLLRTDRAQLMPPVYYGIGAAILCSTVLGFWLESVADNPMTEAILAMTAGIMVGSFTIHMLKVAKNMGGNIRNTIDTHAARNGAWAAIGMFAFITLMITREGMETVLMMSSAAYEMPVSAVMAGAGAGLALAVLMGYFWVKKSHLIQIGRFLQVSSIFLILFSLQMFLKGMHELLETGVVPPLANNTLHIWEENVMGDNSLGSNIITYALVAVPLAWLLIVSLRDYIKSPSQIGAN